MIQLDVWVLRRPWLSPSVNWPALSVKRESWDVLCSSIVEVAGLALSRRLEQVRCKVWKVWLRTKRGLSARDVSVKLAPVSAVRGAEMMGLSWDEKWRWNTFSFDTSNLGHFLFATLNCALWELKTLSCCSAQFYSIRAIFMSSYYLPHPVGGGNGWKCQNYESEGCNINLTYTPPPPPANLEN